jgi:cytochrome c oxidase subunit 2
MAEYAPPPGFDDAFRETAERHERIWIFIAATMLVLLLVGTMFFVVFDYGVVVKTDGYNADPPAAAAAFADESLTRTGPNTYSVHMVAQLWRWRMSPLHVPRGATVTFYVTSADVVHGFEVQGTTINVTAIPGIVGSVTYTFTEAGTFNILCNEYCGIEHHAMVARIVVDQAAS